MERKRREGSLTHEDPDGEGEQSSFKHLRSHRCCSLAYWNRSVISSNKWLETEKTSNCTREAIILWHLTSTEMRERKWGGTRIWTRDLLICSQLLYHWAIPPLQWSANRGVIIVLLVLGQGHVITARAMWSDWGTTSFLSLSISYCVCVCVNSIREQRATQLHTVAWAMPCTALLSKQ